MTVAHPYLRLLRKLLQHRFVERCGAGVVAEVGEHGGLEIAIAGIARFLRDQLLYLRECRGGLALAVEHRGVVVTSRIEARREFEAALEQRLGIRVATQPRGHLRQHA